MTFIFVFARFVEAFVTLFYIRAPSLRQRSQRRGIIALKCQHRGVPIVCVIVTRTCRYITCSKTASGKTNIGTNEKNRTEKVVVGTNDLDFD